MKRKYIIRKTVFFLIMPMLVMDYSMLGQTIKPDSAQIILKAAVTDAQSSNRNVFLIFHATWCKWCKRLEAALNDPEIKTLIDKNYVVVMLDVQERGDKIQTHENPGGQKLLSDFGGNNAGLPFVVFLNRKGKMIANSNVMPKKQNIGYPGSKEEIATFTKLLKKTAPHLIGKQGDVIQKYFELHAPK
ncbi:MAG: thioredoxin family protein [Ignavibacteriales bacterium]|nr:thioredoxin family protein [Ignavibacteriales bacterium]